MVLIAALVDGLVAGCSHPSTTPQPMQVWGSGGDAASGVWAVGVARRDGRSMPAAAHWNGTTWTTRDLPAHCRLGGVLHGVASLATDDIWAVGQCSESMSAATPFIVHFDGESWTAVRAPLLGGFATLRAVDGDAPDDVWAVGARDGGESVVDHWDGSAWTSVRGPDAPLGSVTAVGPSDVWAVSAERGGPVAHWTGEEWHSERVIENPAAVASSGSRDVWVVGSTGSSPTHAAAARFDGSSWHRLAIPGLGIGSTALTGVSVVGPDDVWAIGTRSLDEQTTGFVLHWDGHAWKTQTPPGRWSLFRSVTVTSAQAVWVFGVDSQHASSNAARWNGHGWTIATAG